jgi:hypothetical protein
MRFNILALSMVIASEQLRLLIRMQAMCQADQEASDPAILDVRSKYVPGQLIIFSHSANSAGLM